MISIQKDEAVSLPCQISDIIRNRIMTGEYAPGKKLDTIKQLAEDFEVSPVTLIKALDILAKEDLINRVPVKGIFVSNRPHRQNRTLYGCYVFPGSEFLPERIGYESWGLTSELYKGMLSSAVACNINLEFVHINPAEKSDKREIEQQVERLAKFDLLSFGSHGLDYLQEIIAREKIVFRMVNTPGAKIPKGVIVIDYDRSKALDALVEHVMDCGCRRVSAIFSSGYPLISTYSRTEDFLNRCRAAGLTAIEPVRWEKGNEKENLKKLAELSVDFIFCDYTEITDEVYEAALALDKKIGRDFQMAGIASGMIFHGLIPKYTYIKVPRFEMGCKMMSAGSEAIRDGKRLTEMPLFKAKLIQGKSTTPQHKG